MLPRLSSLIPATAALLLLFGCTKEQSAFYGSLEVTAIETFEPMSRAAIDGSDFPQDGHIGLFLFKDEGATTLYAESGCSNVDYSYNSSKSKWTANPSIKVGSETGYLYGYYPYSSEATNIKAIPVSSSLNGDDVMYATKQTVTSQTASQTSIIMNHALARVSITVKNKGYTGAAKLSSIKFADAKTSVSGSLDATTGTISGTTKADVTLNVPSDNQIVTSDGTLFECLLVPSEVDSDKQDVTLTFTIDGSEKTVSLSDDNGVIIAKGTKSNITITLSNSGVSVSSVSIDEWKEVEVGGHKVTVKVADDIAAGDIMFAPYVDGNNVIIKANSFQGTKLICNVGDNAKCEQTITNGKYIFTISEISSDIEAVLGYAPVVTLTVTSDSNGKVWIGDDKNKANGQFEQGEQVVIHAAPNDNFRFFRWDDNNKESNRTITIGVTDVTYSASFIYSDLIPGLFTVDANKKQVFFSKGNLYYDGSNWGFEAEQYYFRTYNGKGKCDANGYSTSSGTASGHWGLFGLSTEGKNFGMSTSTSTDSTDDYSGNFRDWGTAIDNKSTWSTLTGGDNGEWKYLFDHHVNVWGTCNSVPGRFIAPDGFVGDASALSEAIKDWESAQEAGIVFLPAAGNRDGSTVYIVGVCGFYWSSTVLEEDYAYCVDFYIDGVYPGAGDFRSRGCSIRLVTEEGSPAPSVVPVESVSLDKTAATLDVNGTVTLSATVLPDNATDKSVSWSSNNTGVATVDASGKVTAVAAGTATITVTTTDGGKTATCTVTVYDLPDGVPDGALPGKFSVSATKKVYFSRGNLYADGNKALNFEANQYSSASSWEASHVSHFYWSKDVNEAVELDFNVEQSMSAGDVFFTNADGFKVNVDGKEQSGWRTLSTDEWQYLFNYGSYQSDIRENKYKWATVNGVGGYVIAPDDFTGTLQESYADDAALAANNLVFLPATGFRYGSDVTNVGVGGYWSSTAYVENFAYSVNFNSSYVGPGNGDYRYTGFSVRLITESN